MLSERELVGLLHRADWTKLTLSGTVTGAGPVVDTVVTVQSDERLSWPWQREDDEMPPPPRWLTGYVPPWMFERAMRAWGAPRGRGPRPFWDFQPGSEGTECTLSVAPGLRFRADGADGDWALGCDGTRMWHWLRDRPEGTSVSFGFPFSDDRPRPPYRTLLVPSWLLTGYSLVLDGEATVCGRAGVRVLGTRRQAADWQAAQRTSRLGGTVGGGLFASPRGWLHLVHQNEVEAVVDAELGILLRCAERSGDGLPSVTEFSSLDVGAPTEASRFSAPAGSVFGGDKGFRTRGPGDQSGESASTSPGDALGAVLGTAGREAAKTVAGVAAGGLGALIRYTSSRRVDPFTRAAAEDADPEAAMPADEQPPEGPAGEPAALLPDEVLHLLYRSGLDAPSLRATLHQWTDFGAVFAAVPASARGKAFGGVGFLTDAVRDAAREAAVGDHHDVRTVALGSWSEYRIDVVRSAWDASLFPEDNRIRDVLRTVASDGVRQWRVYSDRVVTGPASLLPSDLADLVDASWLLGSDLELSGGGEVRAGGRRAYRIVARQRDVAEPEMGMSWLHRLFFPAVAVVDAETGLVLRLTRFGGGQPTLRQELRDVTELGTGADFGFTPPAGLPVENTGSRRAQDRPGPAWAWARDEPPHWPHWNRPR